VNAGFGRREIDRSGRAASGGVVIGLAGIAHMVIDPNSIGRAEIGHSNRVVSGGIGING
jgi:hypothetical protein